MTSLVTEVLLQAGKLDKDDIRTKVSKLSSLSFELKTKINNIIKQKYGEFNPICTTCQTVLKDISDQQGQAKDIQATLSGVVKVQLQDSTSEFEHLSKEHEQTVALLFALEKICKVTELFDSFSASSGEKDYKDSADALLNIHCVLDEIKTSDTCDIDIFKFLQENHMFQLEGMKYILDEEWRKVISWVLPDNNDLRHTDVVLKLPHLEPNAVKCPQKDKIQDIVYASNMLNCLQRKVQKFAELVMCHIIKPLVNDHALQPDFDHKMTIAQPASLKIGLFKAKKEKNTTDRPSVLFQKIVLVLENLHSNFLCLKTTEGSSEPIMTIFSEHIRDELLELLINKCLALSVPKSKEELDNYRQVAEVVNSFEDTLRSLSFIPQLTDPNQPASKLTTYAANVSFHFANQRCTDILKQARDMMKKDIHNTVLISKKEGQFFEIHEIMTEKTAQIVKRPVGTGFDSQKPSKLISHNTLELPKCHVSQCAIDIMQLAYSTLKEASQSEMACAIQLVSTVRNIFELFYAVVPIYHKESLETLPQLSAIFHNDCMYIGHHLLTLGHQYSSTTSTARKAGKVLSFVDQVPMIRRLGAECLLRQLNRQNDLLMQCLEQIRTFSSTLVPDKHDNAERAMKQVLHLLNHLKKIWTDVLPNNVLRRTLCTLLDSCVSELVQIVCDIEDISEDDSMTLKLVFLLFSEQVPKLFQSEASDKDEAQLPDISWQTQVRKWARLQELVLLLSASLQNIVDRWSAGKGPLAAAFSVAEVKGLIRALFQNTEHRAQAISKIRR